MTKYRCCICEAIYEDDYPVDDICIVCHKGFIRFTDKDITYSVKYSLSMGWIIEPINK